MCFSRNDLGTWPISIHSVVLVNVTVYLLVWPFIILANHMTISQSIVKLH